MSLSDLAIYGGLTAAGGIAIARKILEIRFERKKEERDKSVEKATEFAEAYRRLSGGQPVRLPPFDLVLKTSPANSVTVGDNWRGDVTILRQQLDEINAKIETRKSEIIEVRQIDPVLQATLTLSIENLTKRIDKLEKDTLSKWDVALVVGTVLAGVLLLFGAFVEIAKLFSNR
jgi:hypothetical protein